jgi:hypothetical protein
MGPMAEMRNAGNGNQPTMLAVKSEILLLTRKIEVKNEETYLNATHSVVVDTRIWLTIWYYVC